jgi:hypothetical protein
MNREQFWPTREQFSKIAPYLVALRPRQRRARVPAGRQQGAERGLDLPRAAEKASFGV